MLEMTYNAPTNAGKHVKSNIECACSQRYAKKISFLIGPNDDVPYDVTLFPAFTWTIRHFRWSDKRVVDMSVEGQLKYHDTNIKGNPLRSGRVTHL